ncbi:large-conductance mechanosensitive channel [Chytridium lagenaria]|nr:large-conductance mechanosensitive channel [Chytridium lagenaria]
MNNQKPDTIDNVQIEVTTGRTKTKTDLVVSKSSIKTWVKSVKALARLAKQFHQLSQRGNVVDLAVGVVMGAAFTAIVNSLVNDIITPIIGLATEKNLENTFVVIKCKVVNGTKDPNCIEGKQGNYSTVTAANAAGALTLNW